MKDYFLLAWKNLHRRKLRSWLTLIGIFIGVSAVVALISVGQSLETGISSQFSELEPDKIIVQNANAGFGPPGAGAIASLSDNEVKLIERNPRVKIVFPQYLRPSNAEFNNVPQMTYVSSIPMDSKSQEIVYSSINDFVENGSLLSSSDSGKVVLGYMFSNEEYFGKEVKIGDKITINDKEFKIKGILEQTGTFTKNMAIYILDEDVEKMLDVNEEYDYINVYVKDIKQVEQVAEEIRESLRKDRNEDIGEESFTVTTAKSNLDSINNILFIVRVIVIAIATISLVIGGIGVANTMFTSVLERRDEIGIEKAIGAKNSAIQMIFLFESGLLCFIGGILGALFGILLSFSITSITSALIGNNLLKINISWSLLIGAALFSFVVGILAGYIPAMQASKLNPVEALRK